MLRSSQATQVPPQHLSHEAPEVQVRIDLEETAHEVRHLTAEGFTTAPAAPRTPGMHAHVSFQLPGGLSISFEVVARAWQQASRVQRFDFVDADPDLLELLLTTADSRVIH